MLFEGGTMHHLPNLRISVLFLALIAGACAAPATEVIEPTRTPVPTPTPTPLPLATPTPEPTPVVPPTGGTYELTVEFTLEDGACGGPESFQDVLVIEIADDGQTITFTQPSTGDVNTGLIQPDGTFEVSSEKESYSGQLEFERDQTGVLVRLKLRAVNRFEDLYGCITVYEAEGELEF
jgi:hypothetical protein